MSNLTRIFWTIIALFCILLIYSSITTLSDRVDTLVVVVATNRVDHERLTKALKTIHDQQIELADLRQQLKLSWQDCIALREFVDELFEEMRREIESNPTEPNVDNWKMRKI